MKNINKTTLLLFLVFPFLLNAQLDDSVMSSACFTDQLHEMMLNEHTDYASKYQEIEQQIYFVKKHPNFSSFQSVAAQTIPVVVHIVHQNGAENIPDGQVFDAIQQLNEAFANIGVYDPSTGVDTEIEFCLASRDPQNNSSNGINRIVSPLTNVTVETQDLELKGLLQWNPLDYLNIWVVNEITSLSAGPGVAGYAFLPAAHGLAHDGIVVEANFVGSSTDNTKVLVHEAGHYLGLYHTFEGNCTNDNCQTNGDRVSDTPPDQSTAYIACGESMNTCNTDENDTSTNNPFRSVALGGLGEQNDMHINYMDYSHLSCYSAFTAGQKERMNNVLLMPRQSLLESYACQEPCPLASFDAVFSSSPSSPVLAGELVAFTNSSDPADLYKWSIDNQIVGNSFDLDYTFSEEGAYNVSLEIRDTTNSCKSTAEEIIEVICVGEASFSISSTEALPGETVNFTNTSTGNTSYQWFLDGALYSTGTDLNITFTNPGFYTVYLIGVTPTCLNYSTTVNIIVGTCGTEDKSEMHWYFGENSALDFNSGEAVPVPGSQINSYEGTACISDDNGDLLFYTDGIRVWDATNTIMPNGSDLLGGSNTSAWDQALVIPRPHSPNQYYVFTCDDFENNMANGIRYSVVDMTLNGGLGDVTTVKNVFVCPANIETMSAAYHADGENAWLVVPDYNVLNTYRVDSTGVGPAIPYSDVNYTTNWGFAKFLNSGKRILFSQQELGTPLLVMFEFDNANGLFSNPIEINTSSTEIWSMEVSPDDSRLYGSLGEGNNSYGLYQFDLSLTTGPQISNSKTYIGDISLISRLLLAPNGRMYQSDFFSPYLGVINNPNELGTACDFVPEFVDLSPSNNAASFPKFIRGQRAYSEPTIPIVNLGPDQSICNGLTSVLNPGGGDYDYLWQDGSTDSTYTAWLPGTYWVTASNACGSVTDSVHISLESLDLVDLGDDMSYCDGVTVTLDVGNAGDSYLWQDGSSSSTFEASEPGVYWVAVSTQAGCYESDTITIALDTEAPVIDCPLHLDTLISFGTSEILLNPGLPVVTDDCSYTFVNDFTITDNATAIYPAGTTTTLIWTVTDANGNTSTCNMDVTVSISTATISLDNDVSSLILYPNPSNGLFVLEETQNNINDIQLSVFDPLGRKIYEQFAFLNGKMQIDLSEQATGVYFLHWSTNEGSGVFKLVFESR